MTIRPPCAYAAELLGTTLSLAAVAGSGQLGVMGDARGSGNRAVAGAVVMTPRGCR